jgi:hypothetical protein
VIALPILFVLVGLLVGVTFAFDVASTASGLASWHSRNALRYRRYYRFTDPWSLSSKTAYWRWFGAMFGVVFFVVGSLSMLAALGIVHS